MTDKKDTSGRLWPFIIVGLLAVSVVANVILLAYATNDPAFAVEPDYYKKAVDWDDTQAAKAASAALGWRVVVEAGRDELKVHLFDKEGKPLSGANVQFEAFHNARANRVVKGTLEAEGPGLYAMNHDFGRPGIWEYRLVAARNGDTFLHTTQEEIR